MWRECCSGVDVSCSELACLVPGELCIMVLSGVVFSDSGTWIPDVLSLKAGTVKRFGLSGNTVS